MELETREKERGTLILVETDEKVAVVVKDYQGERIYLPEVGGEDTSYYVEEPESLRKTEEGYVVLHDGEVENVEVIS